MDMNNLGHSAALSGALVMSEVTLGTSFKIGFTLHNIKRAGNAASKGGRKNQIPNRSPPRAENNNSWRAYNRRRMNGRIFFEPLSLNSVFVAMRGAAIF
jgi:hypothetical protein